ncbi:MAG: histidine kinase [Planctomycetes bacterium]|nr:histidine kinase [Planctomycetota bacterium]NBY02219.1 histidine kinase [Planctomycetota bacterium]
MAKTALVIGKFYPPHRGHKFLIDAASVDNNVVHVILCQKSNEVPEGKLRKGWLQEIHPHAIIKVIDDVYDPTDSALWAQLVKACLGFIPDVVFTSEDYGTEFSRLLGSKHVLVDKNRLNIPISATQIRSNPWQYWEFFEPPVREYYAIRVVMAGAESTGKTTLSRDLAKVYETNWVPEFGRSYSERKIREGTNDDWATSDFVTIANEQCLLENNAARLANRVLICDTDAFATAIWHRRYLKERSPEVEAIALNHRSPDLVILTDIATPFEQDGVRDGELIRGWMHDVFLEELIKSKRRFIMVKGTPKERLEQACSEINRILKGPCSADKNQME